MKEAKVAHGIVIGAFSKQHYAEYMLKHLLNENTSYVSEDFVIVYRKDAELSHELICINYRYPLKEIGIGTVMSNP